MGRGKATKASEIAGQITSFWAFEAIVIDVIKGTGQLVVRPVSAQAGSEGNHIIPPLYYGGMKGVGMFAHPSKGDRVLCIRVHPGARGSLQAIKLLPKPLDSDGNEGDIVPDDNVPTGTTNYPISTMDADDIRLVGFGGGQLQLTGSSTNCNVYLGNDQKSGLYISLQGIETKVTTVGHTIQAVSTGSRTISGDAIRYHPESDTAVDCGHKLTAYCKNTDGKSKGIWPGRGAVNTSSNNILRNPAISEYRLVINEISEHAAYTGWDEEHAAAAAITLKEYSSKRDIRAIAARDVLSLAPHQLIEIIGGNVVNFRGETLDPNYGIIKIGDANGDIPLERTPAEYEKARLTTRRGIGYHFQLSTNSISTDGSNDYDNFVYAVDKEGTLKVNVPRSSSSGNVLYPTEADFSRNSGGTLSTTANPSVSEKIPVTLRDEENNVVFPPEAAGASIHGGGSGDTSYSRNTGIRYTNEDSYFHNLDPVQERGSGERVRVNTTKYHNMYAAAEMLIANLIQSVKIPFITTKCPGIVLGNAIGQPFEKKSGANKGTGDDPNDVTFMTTVEVLPGEPAIYSGGGVVVAGQDFTPGAKKGIPINVPYTNSFAVAQSDEGFNTATIDKTGDPRKPSGGVSANLNFEGSIEASIGKDNFDEKSIVLDTAGGVVAWFGKDTNGRSMIVQTDGDVMLNVGGRTGDNFKAGRFDLRVNVTDKGYLGQEKFTPEGGAHAADYIISISEAGLVIAGVNPGVPMIIRNDGNLCLESTCKLILSGNAVEVRQANRTPRETHKAPCSDDPGSTPSKDPMEAGKNVIATIDCITDLIADITNTE